MSDSDDIPPTGALPPKPDGASATVGLVWQEQDVMLRDLWGQNRPPQEISAILGRSVAAIMTRAARLGLPRRSAPGRKPGVRRALPEGEIRRVAPRPAINRAPKGDADPQPSTRICLMCLKPFLSQGRHNRICSACKSTTEYGAAVSLTEINLPVT